MAEAFVTPEPVMKSEVSGRGEPIVLVPGGLTGWLSWRPHAQRLAERRQVILVQLLAVDHGLKGEPLPADYSVETESRALGKALDALGLPRADFAAWSFGAETLLDFALGHPERVNTMTLIEPPAFWVLRCRGQLSPEAAGFQQTLQTFGPGDITEAQLAQFTHFAGFVPLDVVPQSVPQWPVWSQHRQSLRTGDAAFRHDDDLLRVTGFAAPVLLFKGVGSPGYLREIIDILGEEFPHAQVQELPGAHALHIVSMDRFLEILGEFLKGRAQSN